MVQFLSCVGFDFPKSNGAMFYDAYMEMLEYYEETSSEKMVADGKEYLILNADRLKLLFPLDARGDANADEVELFFETGRWQPAPNVKWCAPEEKADLQLANICSQAQISCNICVPGAYAETLNPGEAYEMQIACFATKCSICAEEAFLQNSKMAPMSILNTGSFQGDASCRINGRIKAVTLCENPYSHRPYDWICVECNDVVFDVVADRDAVSGDIRVGDILTADGWLMGKFRPTFPHMELTQ